MSTHRKSTLPSLLDAYLPPQHKKQRHLEVYKNMYRLWNAMRLHYMDLLSKKVQQQRHEIKERDLQFQRNIEEQEKKQNTTRRLFGQQSECSQLCHNVKYLKSIPKSHNYMIVELQNQLAKSGILKNRGDYEDFWRLIKQNSRALPFETKLQDVKLKMMTSLPPFNNRLVQDEAKSPCVARMKNNHLTTGGLPGLPTFQHINHLESKQKKVQEETEQMFPKMKNLKMVQEKAHHREVQLDQLYQMYSCSFANMAAAQRLLERSGYFIEFEEPNIQDLMFRQETNATGKITQSQRTSIGSFLTLSDAHLCEEPKPRSPEESEKQDETSGGINVEAVSQKLKEQSQNQVAPDPVNVYVPLNIEDILPNSHIVETKRPNSLWINYANMGI
ncbi:uncharacterized protein si:ch211-130h14.4 isoform X2 [Heptranchias perlo]|uniref:uncharacterized protein si:ch211-130h14.4 isoform X2 n=1 Tax=Heptranchias perlo TaxID=212740 RepID=UPI00355A120E